jgi:hypothetical protein
LACPPHLGAPGSIGTDEDLFGAVAGLTQSFLFWLADLDPAVDGSGSIPLSQGRFIFGADHVAERQDLACMEREGGHSYYQALLRLGWMTRERKHMVLKVLAIQIGDLQHGLMDGRVRSHTARVGVRGVP